MEQSKRVYLSEFAINLCSSSWVMTSADQLLSGGTMKQEELKWIKQTHIYLICQQPTISFSKDSVTFDGDVLSGRLNYKKNGDLIERNFSVSNFSLIEGETKIVLESYPHRKIISLDSNGNIVRLWPASAISLGVGWHSLEEDLRNLEVLYIGQAYGTDGTISTFDRLKNHSTFQKILAITHAEQPDMEIQILAFEYHPHRVISLMDARPDNVISDYRDMERFENICDNPLTEQQEIYLIEAGLIRYFQPKYNMIFKENFPDEKHKILKSCYDLDFSGLVVEIDTEYYNFCLFTSTIQPRGHHLCKFDLLDPDQRWGFFHYLKEDGTAIKSPNVMSRNK